MWENFATAVKNFHNVDLKEILGLRQATRGKLDGAKLGGKTYNLTLGEWLRTQF
jgi:hypothetical protein